MYRLKAADKEPVNGEQVQVERVTAVKRGIAESALHSTIQRKGSTCGQDLAFVLPRAERRTCTSNCGIKSGAYHS